MGREDVEQRAKERAKYRDMWTNYYISMYARGHHTLKELQECKTALESQHWALGSVIHNNYEDRYHGLMTALKGIKEGIVTDFDGVGIA